MLRIKVVASRVLVPARVLYLNTSLNTCITKSCYQGFTCSQRVFLKILCPCWPLPVYHEHPESSV